MLTKYQHHIKYIYATCYLLCGLFVIGLPTQAIADSPSNPGADATTQITILARGLVCDFCAQGIYKTFKRIETVQDIFVNLEKGLVVLRAASNPPITDAVLHKMMLDNGFNIISIKRET